MLLLNRIGLSNIPKDEMKFKQKLNELLQTVPKRKKKKLKLMD